MQPYHLSIASQDQPELVELDTPNVQISLIVAAIILDRGEAELRQGDKHLARLRKCGDASAPFWKVGG